MDESSLSGSSPARSAAKPGGRARAWAMFGLKLAVSAGILAACFAFLDVSALPEVLTRIDPFWFAAVLASSILGTIVVPAMLTRRALEIERIRLSLRELVVINFAVRFYTMVLPRAASIGIRWLRYRQGGDGHDALALMVYERLIQLFAMMAIGTVALAFEHAVLGAQSLVFLGLMGGLSLAVGAMLAPFLFPATARWLAFFVTLADRWAPAFIARRLRKLLAAVQAFQGLRPGTSTHIVLLALAAYALFILSSWIAVVALDIDVSLAALAWVRPLVFLLTLFPFTVAGLGAREAGFVGLLHLYGIPASEALALSLVMLATQLIAGAIGAGLELWRYLVRPTAALRRRKSAPELPPS